MITQIAQHWRMKGQRYQLAGHTCPSCQTKMFQPRHICVSCGTSNYSQSDTNTEAETPILVQFVKSTVAATV